MNETGPKGNFGNPEQELRLGLVNDALDRIERNIALSRRIIHMDSREPNQGLDDTYVPSHLHDRCRVMLQKTVDTVTSNWLKNRNESDEKPSIDFVTMDAARSQSIGMWLTTVQGVSGSISRYGFLMVKDDGLETEYSLFADENGATNTFHVVNLPKDEYYKKMINIVMDADPSRTTLFSYVYTGALNTARLESSLGVIEGIIRQSVNSDETSELMAELRRRYETAAEVHKMRKEMGMSYEMSDIDLLGLCDKLDRKFFE